MLTLGQAAKESGVSKTAIARAIKNGRMSAAKNELGEYQIDPAELFRVYPVTGDGDRNAERDAPPKDSSGLQVQLEGLREVLRQIEGERDDLRRRLDNSEAAREREAEEREKAAAELRRLTLLITDQRPDRDDDPRRSWPFTFWFAATAAALGLGLAAWRLWEGQP